jgi:hypothetical protein
MIDHETARPPSSARIPRFDVTNLHGCACGILVGLASRLFSLGSGKGDIEFR